MEAIDKLSIFIFRRTKLEQKWMEEHDKETCLFETMNMLKTSSM